ncbi:energy transducer TonB [Undibacterium flavidum]|uniref:Energy transducer TonB n=1 Tax=Undibacterium flavidum TaxID=2762297 RepID=A0ABR6Y896_9BURK|nr:energy transducer TonB [Undibacterium flavidum]MBC3872379.1 energy transducer TonB [Undibacterium flavidum]
MNTLQAPQLPRRFATGSVIALLHVVIFGLIILNPVKHFQHAPKETIVMMVPSILPKPVTPVSKEVKTTNPLNTAAPVVQQLAIQHTTQDAITAAPTTAELTQPVITAPVAAAPTIAKVEPAGPKVINAVEYIQAPQADYPPMARRMGEEGRVVMQVLVNDKGRAEKVEILKSSGFARLDESAKVALLRALFKPYVEDGKATMVLATASINFSLRG